MYCAVAACVTTPAVQVERQVAAEEESLEKEVQSELQGAAAALRKFGAAVFKSKAAAN